MKTLISAAVAAFFVSASAHAACLPLPEFERQAFGQHKETPLHYGTVSNGWTMTVWVSAGGGDLDSRGHLSGWEARLHPGRWHRLDRRQRAERQG